MTLYFTFGVLLQVALLTFIWASGASGAKAVLYRFFNPQSFFVLFYSLFFMIEQIVFVFTGRLVEDGIFSFAQGDSAFGRTQVLVIAFLFCVWLGSKGASVFLPSEKDGRVSLIFDRKLSGFENVTIWAYFVIGVFAALYLGYRFSNLVGYRSALVKSFDGVLATSLSFFANFAFSYLLFDFARRKRFLLAFVVTVIFGIAILYTGSRGRFLWPVALAFACIFSASNKLPTSRLIVAALVGLVVLSIMDPLRKALVTGGAFNVSDVGYFVADTFLRRNFDGFSNFNIIVNSGVFHGDISNLPNGARDVFMGTFFPDVIRSGVAFGSTFPGYFYIVGGLSGLLVFGGLYGVFLTASNLLLRKFKTIWMFISYAFAMTWLTAVGGDLIESLGKLSASIAPGVILVLLLVIFRNSPAPVSARGGRMSARSSIFMNAPE